MHFHNQASRLQLLDGQMDGRMDRLWQWTDIHACQIRLARQERGSICWLVWGAAMASVSQDPSTFKACQEVPQRCQRLGKPQISSPTWARISNTFWCVTQRLYLDCMSHFTTKGSYFSLAATLCETYSPPFLQVKNDNWRQGSNYTYLFLNNCDAICFWNVECFEKYI